MKFVKKSNVNKVNKVPNLLDIVDGVLQNLISSIGGSVLSLDDLVNKYGNAVDEIIINAKKNEKLNFIDGKFFIRDLKDNAQIGLECYFQTEDKKWIKKDAFKEISYSKLSEEAIKEIKEEKLLKFDITEP